MKLLIFLVLHLCSCVYVCVCKFPCLRVHVFKYICVCVSVCIWGPRVYRKLSLQEPTCLSFELVSSWDLNPLICLDGQPASPMGPLVSSFPVGRVQVHTTMPSLFYTSIVNQTQALLCHMIYLCNLGMEFLCGICIDHGVGL